MDPANKHAEVTPNDVPVTVSISNRRPPDLDIIRDFAIRLLKQNTLEELLWQIAESIGNLPGFEDSVIYLVEDDVLTQKAAFGVKTNSRQILAPIQIPVGTGIVGSVAASGVAEIIGDTRLDSRYIRDQFAGLSELAVPVNYAGNVIAVLDTESKFADAYSVEDRQILQTMANISASRIASAISEEQTRIAQTQLAELNRDLENRVNERSAELQSLNAVVTKERDRLVSILDSLNDGLICVDSQLNIVLFGPSAEQLTGWDAQSALGMPVADVFQLANEESISQHLVSESSPSGITQEATLIQSNGSTIEIRWSLGRTRAEAAKDLQYVIVFADITQQKKFADQMEQVNRIESLGVMAGGIAHDFNNHLSVILAAVESIDTTDSNLLQQVVRLVNLACTEAQGITKQLVTFSRGGEPVRKIHRIEDLLKTSTTLATSGTGIQIRWTTKPNLPAIHVDSGQFKQVLNNVILNAVQAMSGQGEIEIHTDLAVENHSRFVEVRIRDFGPGIPEEHLASVFDPYFTSKPQGTGLGLTTSYFIIRNHGGSIVCFNHPDGGSEFRVRIPESKHGVDSADQSSPKPTDSLRVLVMDDDHGVRNSTRLLLESMGHRVTDAVDGDDAIELLKPSQNTITKNQGAHGQFDLAILDLTVPHGRGGAEIVPELISYCPNLVCIACSGYNANPVMSRFEDYGFHAALPKPFRRAELQREIQAALKNSE